jgi:alkanesulfonate monooxygenase SsuD/methylene tetrahydromethanopterin reductase-like flavin-dependent oxidoreductase (luciferase family)
MACGRWQRMGIDHELSSEEHGPTALVRYAQAAGRAGFTFGLISDHFHPVTERLRLGTGVTCPTVRMHPAIVAQATATAAA